MSNLLSLTAKQLNQAAKLKEKIDALNVKLAELLGASVEVVAVEKTAKRKNKFSAAGLAKIKAAQKARWAKIHAAKADVPAKTEKKAKRKMSAAGRAKIAAGQKARWAKVNAEKLA